jgi:hypothetical protein
MSRACDIFKEHKTLVERPIEVDKLHDYFYYHLSFGKSKTSIYERREYHIWNYEGASNYNLVKIDEHLM